MGKITGIGGYISGKVGSIVYMKGENGETYGRTYVPNPANPKSPAQLAQRAKVNLVGRLSGITPKSLIAPLGMGGRKNRSMFSKTLLDGAVATFSDDQWLAKVEPATFVYARGAQALKSAAAAPTVQANAVSVALTLSDAALAGKYGERIAVVVIDPDDFGGGSSVNFKDVVLENTTATTVSIPIDNTIKDGCLVAVYRAPFAMSERAVAIKTSGLYNNTTDFVAALMISGQDLLEWGESNLIASQVFTQA